MVYIPQIQSTMNYDCFQFNLWNREVSKSHVEMLASDPTFPMKYPTSPTIVDSNFNVIDGQHRCKAAQKLNIPIYFIIDPTATQDDIKNRNSQSRPWIGKNYVHFYAETGKKSYKIIKEILEKHEIPLTYLNPIIVKMYGYKQKNYSYIFKKGELSLDKHEGLLIDICNKLYPVIKLTISIKGKEIAAPLFTGSYLCGFTHFYLNDNLFFNKILEKLPKCAFDFPYRSSYESARESIKKIVNWSPSKKIKD